MAPDQAKKTVTSINPDHRGWDRGTLPSELEELTDH